MSEDSREQLAARVAELEAELERSREHQQGNAAVLEMISGSRADVEQVLVEIAQASLRLCGADESYLVLSEDGEAIRRMDLSAGGVRWYDGALLGLTAQRPADRAYLEAKTVHLSATTHGGHVRRNGSLHQQAAGVQQVTLVFERQVVWQVKSAGPDLH